MEIVVARAAKKPPAFASVREEVSALKRERIIDAAVDAFYDTGYENSTLDSVASRLQVTKPFIYAHFSSKSELLAEICSRAISSSVTAINEVIKTEASATSKLRNLAEKFVRAVLLSQKHIAIFTREEKNLVPADYERISEMRRDFDKKLTDLLAKGVADKEFSLSDPRVAALAIGGMVSWTYIWYRPTGRLHLEQLTSELCRLIMAVAGARPATS